MLLVGLGVGVASIKRSTEVKVGAQEAVLSLIGPSGNTLPPQSQLFDIDVYLDTKGLNVTAADLKIKYDPNVLEGVSIENRNSLPVTLLAGKVDNTLGVASITLGSNPSNPISGGFVLATLKLKVKNRMTTTVLVNNSSAVTAVGFDKSVISSFPSISLVASSSPSPLPIVTPTPISTPTATPQPTSPTVSGCGTYSRSKCGVVDRCCKWSTSMNRCIKIKGCR